MPALRYKKLPFGILRSNRSPDGLAGRLKKAGIPVCPECLANWDLFSYRTSPAQDSCGHIKCNNCMNTNFGLNEMCFQCKPLSSTNRPTASADKPSEPQRPIVKIKEVLTEEGQLKKIYIFPKEIRICLERIKTKYDSPLKDPSASKITQSSSSTNKIKSRIQIPSHAPFENSPTNPFDKICSSVEINFKNDDNNNFKGQTTIVPKIVPIRIKIGARPSDTKVVKEKRNSGEERKAEKIPNYITKLPSNGIRPFSCEHCGTGFRRKGKLERHIRKNHSRTQRNASPRPQRVEIEFKKAEISVNENVSAVLLEQVVNTQTHTNTQSNDSTEQSGPAPIESFVENAERSTQPQPLAIPAIINAFNFSCTGEGHSNELSNKISPINNNILKIQGTPELETEMTKIKDDKPSLILESSNHKEIKNQVEILSEILNSTKMLDSFHRNIAPNVADTSEECSESNTMVVKFPSLDTPGLEYKKLPFGILSSNPSPDGPTGILKQSGIPVCPECHADWDLSSYVKRPSQDSCGHVKCNKCMRINFGLYGMCFQCKPLSTTNGPFASVVEEPSKQYGPYVKTKEIIKEEELRNRIIHKFPKELGICLERIVTDYDRGLEGPSTFKIIEGSSSTKQICKNRIQNTSNVPLQKNSLNTIDKINSVEIVPMNVDENYLKSQTTQITPSKIKSNSTVVKAGRGLRRGRKGMKFPDYITVIPSNDNAPPLYQCLKCGKKFKTKALIKLHEFCRRTNLLKPDVCQIGKKTLNSEAHSKYHKRTRAGTFCGKLNGAVNQEELNPVEIQAEITNLTKSLDISLKNSALNLDEISWGSSVSMPMLKQIPSDLCQTRNPCFVNMTQEKVLPLETPDLQYKKLPFGILSSNISSPDGPTKILKQAGISVCPECEADWDLSCSSTSPVQDSCGHIKCNKCMRKNFALDEMCFQCKQISTNNGPNNTNLDEPPELTMSGLSVKTTEIPVEEAELKTILKFPKENSKENRTKNPKFSKEIQIRLNRIKKNVDAKLQGPSVAENRRAKNVSLEINSANLIDEISAVEFNLTDDVDNKKLKLQPPTEIIVPKIKIGSTQSEIARIIVEEDTRSKKRKPNGFIPEHVTFIPSTDNSPALYQCVKCSKKFKSKAHISYHEFCLEMSVRPYVCEICDKGFITKSHFEYHKRTHTGELPYKCPICSKGFNQKGRVTRHIKIHTGEKPFGCSQCEKRFTNKQSLTSHFLIHTGECPYACDFCDKSFTGRTNLRKHLVVHTGDRPFECKYCNKSFGLKWTLDLHLKTHSSDKPCACDVCDRAFCINKDLIRHKAIHTAVRPFPCCICGTAFRRKDNLDRHIRNTHLRSKEDSKALSELAADELKRKKFSTNKNARPISMEEVSSAQMSAESSASTKQSSPDVSNPLSEPDQASPPFQVIVDFDSREGGNPDEVSYEIFPINNHITNIVGSQNLEITTEMTHKKENPLSFIHAFNSEEISPDTIQAEFLNITKTLDI